MRITKKWLFFVLAAIMLLGIAAQALGASTYTNPKFTDVKKSDWFYTYVEQAAEKGWISGYTDGTFGPNNPVTYAEFSTMLMNAFLPYALEWEVNHLSIGTNPWYLPYCMSAADCKLFDTTSVQDVITVRRVDPNAASRPVTRSDMAVIIDHVLRLNLNAKSPSSEEIKKADSETPDVKIENNGLAGLASYYILEVKAFGILNGIDDKGTFAGDQTMTRAQAAVVLAKIEEICNKQGLRDWADPSYSGTPGWLADPDRYGGANNTSSPGATTTPEASTISSAGRRDANGYTMASSVNSAKPNVGKSDTYKTIGRAETANRNGYFTAANVDIGDAQLVYGLLPLVNEARTEEGLAPMQWTYLDSAEEYTLLRAKELTKKFSHERPDNQYNYSTEIVGSGQSNAEWVFSSWMKSSGHRAVIMSKGDNLTMCAARCGNCWVITVKTVGVPGSVELGSDVDYKTQNGFMSSDF